MSKIWMTIKQVERERELATERQGEAQRTPESPWDPVAMYRDRLRPVRWSERLGAMFSGRRGVKRPDQV